MARRIVIIGGAALVLIGLLLWSQLRVTPRKVSGTIEADEIRLGSRVGGRVAEVLTDEGETVRRGQILVRLEPYDLESLEQEAVAALAARQATVDKLTAGFRPEEIAQAEATRDQAAAKLELLRNGPRKEEIEAARGRKEIAAAEYSLAEQNYARAKNLQQENAISRQEVETLEQKLESARSMRLVRNEELALLEAGTREEEIRQAEAELAKATAAWELMQRGYRAEEIEEAKAARDSTQAQLAAIRQRLAELEIRSPVDGVIDAMELQPGDLVAPSAPVLSLVDTSRLWVRAYVPENELGLRLGEELDVTVDSFPKERFLGKLSFIARRAEFTPSNVQTPEERSKQVFRVKVTLTEGLDRLRPGMAADVWLDSDSE